MIVFAFKVNIWNGFRLFKKLLNRINQNRTSSCCKVWMSPCQAACSSWVWGGRSGLRIHSNIFLWSSGGLTCSAVSWLESHKVTSAPEVNSCCTIFGNSKVFIFKIILLVADIMSRGGVTFPVSSKSCLFWSRLSLESSKTAQVTWTEHARLLCNGKIQRFKSSSPPASPHLSDCLTCRCNTNNGALTLE